MYSINQEAKWNVAKIKSWESSSIQPFAIALRKAKTEQLVIMFWRLNTSIALWSGAGIIYRFWNPWTNYVTSSIRWRDYHWLDKAILGTW